MDKPKFNIELASGERPAAPSGAPPSPPASPLGHLALVAIVLVLAAHALFVLFNRRTFSYDDAWYGETSIRFLDTWTRTGLAGAYKFFIENTFGGIKAPLIILAPQPFLLIFGRHDATFLLTNLYLLFLACLYLRALARLYMDRPAADLTVLVFLLMPMTSYLTRAFFVEILLTGVCLAFIYHSVRSDGFSCRKHSLLTGLAFGLGMLTKVTFPLYICGVFALVLFRFMGANRAWLRLPFVLVLACVGPAAAFFLRDREIAFALPIGLGISAVLLVIVWVAASRSTANVFMAATVALAVALPWYLRNGLTIFKFSYSASVGELSKDYGAADLLSPAAIRDYWIGNINFAFGVMFVAALAIMLVFALLTSLIRARSTNPGRKSGLVWLIVLWLLPALVAFTLGRNRTTRFLMPLLPGAAVLYGALFQRIFDRTRWLALPVAAAHVLAAGYVFVILTVGGRTITFGPRNEYVVSGPDLTLKGPLTRSPYPLGEIVEHAARLAPDLREGEALVMSLTDTVHVNQNTLSYTAKKLDKPIYFGMIPYGADSAPAMEALGRAHLLVYQEGGKDFPEFTNRWGKPLLQKIKSGDIKGWKPLDEPAIPLPDGGVVRFMQRQPGEHTSS